MKAYLNLVTNWWEGISPRERAMLIVTALLLVVASLFWGVWQPLVEQHQRAEQRVVAEKRLLSWVQDTADDIARNRGGAGVSNSSALPLNQIVSTSARRFNADLVRVQSHQERVLIWLRPMPFNQFVDWIDYLSAQHGVVAPVLDVQLGKSAGMIEVKRLQFEKR